MLADPLVVVATADIETVGKTRADIARDIRRKEAAIQVVWLVCG